MPEALSRSPLPSVVLVALLYLSDYVLTLICARLYETRVKAKILIEGSFELNPVLRKDVDSGRWLSGRWLLGMAMLCVLFPALWSLSTDPASRKLYLIVVGGMVFLQLAVHTRHLRNLFLFTTALGDDGIRGRIEYPRWVVLSLSAFDFLTFAGLYAVAYALSGSVLLMGGAISCLLLSATQYALRRRLGRGVASPTPGDPGGVGR